MSSINFYLKDPKSKRQTRIYLQTLYRGRKYKYTTPHKTIPKYWNKKKQEVKSVPYSGYQEINKGLHNIKLIADKCYHSLINEDRFTRENFKECITNTIYKPDKIEFFEFFEDHLSKQKNLSKATITDYNQTLEVLKDFQKEMKYKVTFESINLDFYSELQVYMLDVKEHALNTFGKRIKVIKTFMRAAMDRGHHKNITFQHRSFKTEYIEYKQMYLTKEDIKKLIEVKIDDAKHKTSKDLFLLLCFFGIRVGDLCQINTSTVYKNKDNYIFNYRSYKTNEFVIIPVHPIALNIIKKYDFDLPSVRKININKHIKVISKIAGLDGKFTNLKGTNKKHEIIESRTGRRTFATNAMLNSNMPIRSIMAITGHKKESSFNIYVQAKRPPTHEEVYSIYGDLKN